MKKPAKARKGTKRTAAKPRARRAARSPRPIVIDIHAHVTVPEVIAFARGHVVATHTPYDPRMTKEMIEEAERWIADNRRRMSDISLRIADMDRTGVDIQVLSSSTVVQNTNWADAETGLKMDRLCNDRLAELVAAHPDRFVALGGVPLQSPAHAIVELERCMKQLRFKGIQISSTAGDVELGAASLRPFWARVQELGAVVYLHPAGNLDKRFVPHQFWNSIGQPFEETMAMAALIHDGVMDEFPDLKICIAHGGGYLPYYVGRLDRNYKEKPQTRVQMTRTPSEYLRLFHYDTCVYNVDILEYLVHKVGAGRIVIGSDYPVGEEFPIKFVRQSRKISAEDKEKIVWKNAAKMFGLAA
jgi:aminocarboxymuconate-semialdehyde decarboxylase